MKTIRDIDVNNKTVLVREDFNVPLTDGDVADNCKLVNAIPTINYLKKKGAKIVLMSDLGDTKGHAVPALRMDPVARALEKLLNQHIEDIDETTGDTVRETISTALPGEIILIENLGFSNGEYTNDEVFAQRLASLGDIYVNDAFSIADKTYASNVGITNYIQSCAGMFMSKNLSELNHFLQNIDHPFSLLIGGKDPEGKMAVIERFIEIADYIMVAGLPGLAFLKARGYEIGKADISATAVQMAKDLISESRIELNPIKFPNDFLVAQEIKQNATQRFVSNEDIPPGWYAVDIGPKTVMEFNKIIGDARLAVWNGPVGINEIPDFESGTRAMAQSFASTEAKTVILGDDTVKIINKYNKAKYIEILSNENDIILKYLEGKELPAVKALEKNAEYT